MEHSQNDLFTPRIIIHGGAGNLQRANLPPERQAIYKASLIRILNHGNTLLQNGASALDAATSTVAQFEDDPLFNCARGAVFNRAGEIELEASLMVSSGYKKKCVAVSLLRHVKNPIIFAKKILEEGEHDMDPSAMSESYTAQGHVHISGHTAENLAKSYGLELRPQKYFWTRKRWDEHKRGLEGKPSLSDTDYSWTDTCGAEETLDDEPSWDGHEYLPQGTVGCVVMDKCGVVCSATSTGGLTNKLPGRIGDTPTVGAGFWAEDSDVSPVDIISTSYALPAIATLKSSLAQIIGYFPAAVTDCLPAMSISHANSDKPSYTRLEKSSPAQHHVLGLSGTGNGDSFLRVAACRTASALALPPQVPAHLRRQIRSTSGIDLQLAVTAVAGQGGILQQSAGDRWNRTGEGEGGIIGLERRGDHSHIVFDFNSGGMYRAYIDDKGQTCVGIFRGDDEIVHSTDAR